MRLKSSTKYMRGDNKYEGDDRDRCGGGRCGDGIGG